MSTMPQGTAFHHEPFSDSTLLLTCADSNSFLEMANNAMGVSFADEPLFDAGYSTSHFTAVNGMNIFHSNDPATVSPKDLLRDPLVSAPPSTAFTNLTSPSIFDSPDVNDSFETSPLFEGADLDAGNDQWFSLFPVDCTGNDQSPANAATQMYEQTAYALQNDSTRLRASPGQSPLVSRAALGRHSSVAGVGAKRRDKPLPPIIVDDPSDSIAIKRARNTSAARKSRMKKVQKFDEMEQIIDDLKAEVARWKDLALSRHPDLQG